MVWDIFLRLWPARTRAPSPHGRVYGGSQKNVPDHDSAATVFLRHREALHFALDSSAVAVSLFLAIYAPRLGYCILEQLCYRCRPDSGKIDISG